MSKRTHKQFWGMGTLRSIEGVKVKSNDGGVDKLNAYFRSSNYKVFNGILVKFSKIGKFARREGPKRSHFQ